VRATLTALADAARIGAGDKLHLKGVFDTIFAEAFPAIHGTMALVVRLQLDPSDQPGRYHFEIDAGRTHAVLPLRVLARTV